MGKEKHYNMFILTTCLLKLITLIVQEHFAVLIFNSRATCKHFTSTVHFHNNEYVAHVCKTRRYLDPHSLISCFGGVMSTNFITLQ